MATSKLVQQTLNGTEIDKICDDLDRSVNNHSPLSSSIGLFSLIIPEHSQPLLSGLTPYRDILLDSDQRSASPFPTSINSSPSFEHLPESCEQHFITTFQSHDDVITPSGVDSTTDEFRSQAIYSTTQGSGNAPSFPLHGHDNHYGKTPPNSHVVISQGPLDSALWDHFGGSTFQDIQLPSVFGFMDKHTFNHGLLPSSVAPSLATILPADNRQPPPPDGFELLVPSPSFVTNVLPDTTYFLLDHYKTNMLASFSPKQNPYPPWKVLHLPSALQAVSEISIWGSADHVRTSLLYSILALCAFNLDASSNPKLDSTTFWRLKATAYCQIAQEQLRLATTSNADEQRPGGIDELVIATVSMNTISVMSGKANQARNFLLAAERMIEQRSVFETRQFREFKMLCNLLLYTRVMEEITHVYPAGERSCDPPSVGLRLQRSAAKETTTVSHNARFPSLSTRVFIETKDAKALRPAVLESSLNDGTQIPHRHVNSTFDDIYGLSESLISLISRTTHAISIIEAGLTDITGPMDMDAMKTLERDICEWNFKDPSTNEMNNAPNAENTKDSSFESTNAAVHTALIIYFYREIRYVHPISIQHFVDKTLLHLLEYERQTKERANFAAAGICWAAFVIGCEATEASSKEQILQLLSRLAEKSGNGNFRTALQFVPAVWKSRTETEFFDLSWRQVLRTSKLELLLS
ncbi:fungal-specific transcription factor domain-containing protein [Ilyonectria sp. MPI-CAGE-AT-0026]|nr:fungal-specific transcription factor domain-containing protein [Ilyonectria sp. MPI-CAGE-AT-0026]